MRDYFSTLLLASFMGAVCTSLAGGKLEKFVRYLASLLCILLIISPLRDLELSPLSLKEQELSLPEGAALSDLAAEEAEKEICAALSSAISAGTGITPASLCIDIDWNTREPVISSLSLALRSEDFPRREEVSGWVEASYGVPCYVTEHEESS